MKRVILLFIFVLNSYLSSFSQSCSVGSAWVFSNFDNLHDTVYVNFNPPYTAFSINVYIDTNNPNNIWQHGVPQKNIFNNTATNKKALVTDTLNFYPTNNISDLVIKIDQNPLFIDCYHFELHYRSNINIGDTILVFNSQDSIIWDNNYSPFNKNCSSNCILYSLQHWSKKFIKFSFVSDANAENMEGIVFDSICVSFMPCPNVPEHEKDYFEIYPNPGTGNFTVEIESAQNTMHNLQCRVLDVAGKTLFSSALMPLLKYGEQKAELNLNHLPNGIYFLQLSTGEQIFTQKIVIQK